MWAQDPKTHEEYVRRIRNVAACKDSAQRHRRALREIVGASAYVSEDGLDFTKWAATIGEAALNPKPFRKATA